MTEDEVTVPRPPFYRRVKRWQVIAIIVILAALVRSWAAWQLPLDADEPTYTRAAQDYARLIKTGDLAGVLSYDYNLEHPPLVKLMYSLPYIFLEPGFEDRSAYIIDRIISVVWGVLAVLVLALIDPLAGFFLALDTMVIKYTSQVYLESFPLFSGLTAVYAIRRYTQIPSHRRWFWLSAVLLGAAVAGKYLYALMGIPILVLFFHFRPLPWKQAVLYVLAALVAFFVLDPALWLNPLGNFWHSLTFHLNYSSSSLDILRANYPWYQPVLWITAMVPWHPDVFFLPGPDVLIAGLALIGAYWEWSQRRWSVVWAVSVLAILLIWQTKWPQYTLVLIPALCLSAATGLRKLSRWLVNFDEHWRLSEMVLPRPGKVFWIALSLFLAAIVSGKVVFEISRAEMKRGWTSITVGISPLPSDLIHDIKIAQDGKIVIAGNGGVAFWSPDDRSPWGEAPVVLTPGNSGLLHNQVTQILQDHRGNWWFGTENGLSFWDGGELWKSYRGADLGLASEKILSLVEDGLGRIWVGTKDGAALQEGADWKVVNPQNTPIIDSSIFAIARQSQAGHEYVWFGTLKGVSRLDVQSGEWKNFDLSAYGIKWAGVSDLRVDQAGRVWVCTLGDGLSVWDGNTWTTFRSSNSNIPLNAVTRLIETSPGIFWVAFSFSTEPGGMLARFDGRHWMSISPANSGFMGGEVTALVKDQAGRMWIGTAVNGIQIYQGDLLADK